MKHMLLIYLLAVGVQSQAQVGFLAAGSRGTQAAPPAATTAPSVNPAPTAIPAGTHLLMKLVSPLHSTSSTNGSGVYLETLFPVVQDGRVAIPEHTRVLGTVQWDRRPGRVNGRAQMRLRFTQLILPDNRVLSIAGRLQSLPGSDLNRTIDREGTIEPVDQIDADVLTVATAGGAGAVLGSVRHFDVGGFAQGAALGAGLGLAKVLFTRGDEISLPVGTRVEIVLQRPLTLQSATGSNPPASPCCDTPESVTSASTPPNRER